jgi:hypothetical protein
MRETRERSRHSRQNLADRLQSRLSRATYNSATKSRCKNGPMPPGFRPDVYLQNPDEFGRVLDARWKSHKKLSNEERAKVGAAYLQHQVAFAVRERLGGVNAPDELAKLLGERDRVDYFRRKLYGQVPINMVELFEWLLVLDDDIAPDGVLSKKALLPKV